MKIGGEERSSSPRYRDDGQGKRQKRKAMTRRELGIIYNIALRDSISSMSLNVSEIRSADAGCTEHSGAYQVSHQAHHHPIV